MDVECLFAVYVVSLLAARAGKQRRPLPAEFHWRRFLDSPAADHEDSRRRRQEPDADLPRGARRRRRVGAEGQARRAEPPRRAGGRDAVPEGGRQERLGHLLLRPAERRRAGCRWFQFPDAGRR